MATHYSVPGPSKEVPNKSIPEAANVTCSRRSLKELSPITIGEMKEFKRYTGHFLACRTVTDASLALGTVVAVEDVNDDETEVSLMHITTAYGVPFPIGTIVVIKEPGVVSHTADGTPPAQPSCGSFIRVTSPSDIVLVEETDRTQLEKLGALRWSASEKLAADELRLKGNDCFKQRDFRGALKYYERALRLEPVAAVLQLNRSAALLRLERFEEAHQSAEHGLAAGSDREKALYRLAQAAYGMRKWAKAKEYLESLLKEFPSNMDASKDFQKTVARLREASTGRYDMRRLYMEAIEQGKRHLDVADYLGPVEVIDIPGKGKGVVASHDVTKGTLLIASKALACSAIGDFQEYDIAGAVPDGDLEQKCVLLNEIRIAQTLMRNPHRARNLYSLWAGEDVPREDEVPEGVIDTARIHAICWLNSLNFDAPMPPNSESAYEPTPEQRSSLHVTPAFVNHSCVGNAYRAFYGDVLMVYAIRDLKTGEEITWSYVEGEQSYEAREKSLAHYGFRCDCALCEMDRSDPRREEREDIAKQCVSLIPLLTADAERLVERLEPLVEDLLRTYTDRSQFRLGLKDPLNTLFAAYLDLDRLDDCVRVAKETIDCLDEFHLYTIGPEIYLKLAYVLNDLVGNVHEAGDQVLGDKYLTERDHYLHLAREYVRIRSGMDIDIHQYRMSKGYLPVIP